MRPEVAINGTHLGGRLNSGERLAGTLGGDDGVFGLDGEGVGFFCVCWEKKFSGESLGWSLDVCFQIVLFDRSTTRSINLIQSERVPWDRVT